MRKEAMNIELYEHPLNKIVKDVEFRTSKEDYRRIGTATSLTEKDIFGLWIDYDLYQDNAGTYFIVQPD